MLRTALAAAEAALRVQRVWSGRMRIEGADAKARGDFVSRADVDAQEAALGVIADRHPDHRLLAEEGDPDAEGATLRSAGATPVWVVDPIDGTTNFLHGNPMYAVSVAVAVEGRPVVGVVASAPTSERWWAIRGGGAWKNGRPVRVAPHRDLERCLISTGFPFRTLDQLELYLAQLGAVLRGTSGVRRGGAAALDLAWLAEGRYDAFWELFLNPWDFAAGIVLIEEAGGVVERIDGSPLELAPGDVMAASSRETMEALRGLIGSAPRGGVEP